MLGLLSYAFFVVRFPCSIIAQNTGNFASTLTDSTLFGFCQSPRPSTIFERKDVDNFDHSHAIVVLDCFAQLDFDDPDELQYSPYY